ncbi:CRAL-TRIO domain containing protein [Oryctes borbonicus]|uniref:CRAL-TRIO domain containing protein n=1 Tax=Oryctes borbonicus TaxID=1629725 RepID=A0A0T6AWB7_9SCAR|nr:CRAL-TRIO domain containing protein [Oryctes borbonicus]
MVESSMFVVERDPIGATTKEVAEKELRETPENVANGLRDLRELLESDPSIRYETDDEFLIIFLRPCKFYAKSAYELMKRIAEFRARYSTLFDGLLPEHEKDAFITYNLINILVNRDQRGRRVLICRTGGNWNPSKVTTNQLLRIFYLLHLAALLEPETQVRGIVVVMDVKDLGMSQIRAFTPSFAKKLTSFVQEAFPLRLKEFHVVNNSMIFKIVWQIVKPLLNEKLNKRVCSDVQVKIKCSKFSLSLTQVYFHQKDLTSLHKFLDPDVLPEDYDGTRAKMNYTAKDWYPAIEDYIEFIRKWNSCGKRQI